MIVLIKQAASIVLSIAIMIHFELTLPVGFFLLMFISYMLEVNPNQLDYDMPADGAFGMR